MPKLEFIKTLFYFTLILICFSCSQGKLDPFDKSSGLSVSDVKNTLARDRAKEKEEKAFFQGQTQIPKISKLIISPPPPAIGGDKIISFSITEQVPLKDVLIELGRVAKIDVDVDPKISGGVIINAKNRPLKEIIDRIANQGNVRYSYKNSVLYFEADTPYVKNYFVDYLSGGNVWSDVESNIDAILSLSSGSSGIESDDSSGSEASEEESSGQSSFSSNKSAGIIMINATSKEHKLIEEYLSEVEKYASAQVLIEAKVIEVSLSDKYKTGIDWNNLGSGENRLKNGFDGTTASPAVFVATNLFGSKNISASISALEEFGNTKTISSPRIHAINNQNASLNFADKLVFFKIDRTQSTQAASGGATAANVVETVNSTKQEEKVGVELKITPSINLKTKEITLSISPKLSVKSDSVIDPVNDGNIIPVIQTREINTTAKIQDGNIIVIGGLMKEEASNIDKGVPFFSRIPLFGWFVKSVSKDSKIIETVIFIKATIVNSSTIAPKVDRELQDKLDPNKRRFF